MYRIGSEGKKEQKQLKKKQKGFLVNFSSKRLQFFVWMDEVQFDFFIIIFYVHGIKKKKKQLKKLSFSVQVSFFQL